MPIHLPPLSRRRFLARSLAAGAGALLGSRVRAAEPGADPHLWALLADTHIAADRATLSRGINMADHLAAVARQVVTMRPRPAGAIIAGDCAHLNGAPGDYSTLLEAIAPLHDAGVPVHMIPGNHDNRDNLVAALRGSGQSPKSPVPGRYAELLQAPRANFFLLDSLDQVNVTPGVLGEAQLAWLASALDAHTDRPAIIVTHHCPDVGDKKSGLVDMQALLDVLAPRRQVKAWVFAHSHVWFFAPHPSGIHLVNLPPVAYVFKEGRPSGWAAMALREGGATLTLRSIDGLHPDEGMSHELDWR